MPPTARPPNPDYDLIGFQERLTASITTCIAEGIASVLKETTNITGRIDKVEKNIESINNRLTGVENEMKILSTVEQVRDIPSEVQKLKEFVSQARPWIAGIKWLVLVVGGLLVHTIYEAIVKAMVN